MTDELEKYAKKHNIPIMESDGILFLCEYIKNNNIKKILEIGSAIGYSAIRMALVNDDIYITTLEKDIIRYNEAIKNIRLFNLDSRIKTINIDALKYLTKEKFDLIFIDASKGNNINFFRLFKDNLEEKGTIITDNIGFHGLVDNEKLAITKNQKSIVRKIKNYINFLNNNEEFLTKYVEIGDRLAISRRVNDEVIGNSKQNK